MLAMMVGAVVLSRAVDDQTADRILADTRDSILTSRGKIPTGKPNRPDNQSKKPLRTSA